MMNKNSTPFFDKTKLMKPLSLTVLSALTAITMTGCLGGETSVSGGASESGGNAAEAGSIAISTFKRVYGTGFSVVGKSAQTETVGLSSGGSVSTTSTSNILVTGTCTRGVANIIVTGKKTAGTGSPSTTNTISSTLACSNNSFSWSPASGIENYWSGPIATEGTFQLIFTPYDSANTALPAVTINVDIDTTAPTQASNTVTIGSDVCGGGIWTCGGTYTTTTATPSVSIPIPDATTGFTRMMGGTFSSTYTGASPATFSPTLTSGSSVTYTVQTYDSLGNTAGTRTFTISYTPALASNANSWAISSGGTTALASTGVTTFTMTRVGMESSTMYSQVSATYSPVLASPNNTNPVNTIMYIGTPVFLTQKANFLE
jgi:hypothetical protein